MSKNIFLSIVAAILLITTIQAQNSNVVLNSKANIKNSEAINATLPEICSGKNYLPQNHPRLSSIDLMVQDKNKRMFFAQKNSGIGISVYDGINWSYYDESNGLISNYIYDLYKDSKGNIWIGTDKGLSVYDGNSWISYPLTQFTYKTIIGITEDNNGKMHFFNGNILTTFDGNIWEQKILSQLNSTTINKPIFDKNNNLWFYNSNVGIYKITGTNITIYNSTNGLNSNDVSYIGLIDDQIYCLYNSIDSISIFDGNQWSNFTPPVKNGTAGKQIIKDSKGQLWLSKGGIAYKYFEGIWTYFPNPNFFNLTLIYQDDDENIWFTSSYAEINKMDNTGIHSIYAESDPSIGFTDINSCFIDHNNKLWCASTYTPRAKICNFDGKKWTNYKLPLNSVSKFVQDQNDSIYGVGNALLKLRKTGWVDLGQEWRTKYGINYSYFRNLFIDKKNQLWFIPSSNKIVKFDGLTFKEYSTNDGLLNNSWKIAQDRDSNIWVINTDNNGEVSLFDGNTWSKITLPKKEGYYSMINDVAVDTSGNVWFASYIGLIKYDKNKVITHYTTFNSTMAFDQIWSLSIDKNNNIWMCGANSSGLFSMFTGTQWKNYKFNSSSGAHHIVHDRQNNVYLSTLSKGVFRMNFGTEIPQIEKADITCIGTNEGKITLHPTSDIEQLYSIDNGINFQNDTIYNNLSAGSYNIVAKNGSCTSTPTMTELAQPAGTFEISKKNVTCHGIDNGEIAIYSSGIDNIKYLWANGSTEDTLTNLPVGNYVVTVTHSSNCEFNKEIEISEPDTILLSGKYLNVCGPDKGKIDLSVTGGILPYSFSWSNGKTTEDLNDLEIGDYTVTVTDANNCIIRNTNFSIASYSAINAGSIITKYKDFLCSGVASINANTGYTSYIWQKDNVPFNQNGSSFVVTEPGVYTVNVLNQNNCTANDTIKIINKGNYGTPQICLVTVNELTNKNKIIWNGFRADSLVKIIIEKETNQSDVYNAIGEVYGYEDGIFIDENSTPSAKAERYRIMLSDECSSISSYSDVHKTIHLTANKGTSGEINLIWSGYEGFSFGSYNIYRGTSNNNMTLLTTIQNNLTSYTDLNPPVANAVYYQLEVISPSNCNPDAVKSTYGFSRSNIVYTEITSALDIKSSNSIKISPNPANSYINVEFDKYNGQSYTIKLVDMKGKIMYESKNIDDNSTTIYKNELASGLYILIIEGKEEIYRELVIFQ